MEDNRHVLILDPAPLLQLERDPDEDEANDEDWDCL